MSDILDQLRRVAYVMFKDGWQSKETAGLAFLEISSLRAEITRLQKALDTAREARVTDVDLIKRLVIPMVQERSREPGDAWAQAASALAALQKKEATE